MIKTLCRNLFTKFRFKYFIEIRVNDTSGNYVTGVIKVDILEDTSSNDNEDDGTDGDNEDNTEDDNNNSEEIDNISFGFFYVLLGFLISFMVSLLLRTRREISFK